MPIVKGSPAYLLKLERDRLRKRQRSGRKLLPGEQRGPRKRVDPEGLDARGRELMTLMRGWVSA